MVCEYNLFVREKARQVQSLQAKKKTVVHETFSYLMSKIMQLIEKHRRLKEIGR